MRSFRLFFLLSLIPLICLSQGSYEIQKEVKTIVFLGNSITYSGQYISYIETYMTLSHPKHRYEYINVGLPSETISGLSETGHADGRFPRPDLHERLTRVFKETKPDLVFACYGMNDGIYLPLDEGRFTKYKEGIEWLYNEVIDFGAEMIYITPPDYDSRKGATYSEVLDTYADWLLGKTETDQWKVVDIHWPMKHYLETKRGNDSNFYLAKDGVHPNETGHWIMAQQVLLFLGEEGVKEKESVQSAIDEFANGEEILNLVDKKQKILKDAWLTDIGHLRPGMSAGMPMKKANKKADKIDKKINDL